MKRLNKKEWKKTTKYIAGSAGAVSLAVASCVAGITGSTDVTKYDKEYLAGDDKASDTDATTVMNTRTRPFMYLLRQMAMSITS